MSTAQKLKDKNKFRDSYFEREISVNEYVDRILKGKEGDRKRQNIERKYTNIVQRLELKR